MRTIRLISVKIASRSSTAGQLRPAQHSAPRTKMPTVMSFERFVRIFGDAKSIKELKKLEAQIEKRYRQLDEARDREED